MEDLNLTLEQIRSAEAEALASRAHEESLRVLMYALYARFHGFSSAQKLAEMIEQPPVDKQSMLSAIKKHFGDEEEAISEMLMDDEFMKNAYLKAQAIIHTESAKIRADRQLRDSS